MPRTRSLARASWTLGLVRRPPLLLPRAAVLTPSVRAGVVGVDSASRSLAASTAWLDLGLVDVESSEENVCCSPFVRLCRVLVFRAWSLPAFRPDLLKNPQAEMLFQATWTVSIFYSDGGKSTGTYCS